MDRLPPKDDLPLPQMVNGTVAEILDIALVKVKEFDSKYEEIYEEGVGIPLEKCAVEDLFDMAGVAVICASVNRRIMSSIGLELRRRGYEIVSKTLS